MKYRVVLDVIYNDGTADKVGIYTYNTEDEALKGFYQYMAEYVAQSNVASCNVIAKSTYGAILKSEVWINRTVTTTEETSEDASTEA